MQGLVKGAILCFRNLFFYFEMERVLLQPANSLLKPAKKSKDLNKVPLLLQDLILDCVLVSSIVVD